MERVLDFDRERVRFKVLDLALSLPREGELFKVLPVFNCGRLFNEWFEAFERFRSLERVLRELFEFLERPLSLDRARSLRKLDLEFEFFVKLGDRARECDRLLPLDREVLLVLLLLLLLLLLLELDEAESLEYELDEDDELERECDRLSRED